MILEKPLQLLEGKKLQQGVEFYIAAASSEIQAECERNG